MPAVPGKDLQLDVFAYQDPEFLGDLFHTMADFIFSLFSQTLAISNPHSPNVTPYTASCAHKWTFEFHHIPVSLT